MRSVHLVATELCRFFEEERIDYALLGDACSPARTGGAQRIEIVIGQEYLEQVPLVLHKFCRRNEAKLVTCVREERLGWRSLIGLLHRDQRPEFVAVEVFASFIRRGRLLLEGRELLKDRHLEPGTVRLRPAFVVATPAMEFIYYLLRCVEEGTLSDAQGQHLEECWLRDPLGAAAQTAKFWDPTREGGVIARAAESGDWEVVREIMPLLRKGIRRRKHFRPLDWLYEIRARVNEWIRPSGLLLACLGPVGVGKASVINALKERPLAPFRGVYTMDLRPQIFRGSSTPGRAQRPRGRLATMAKLIMFAFDYWLGYCWQIRPRLSRSMLVLSNRYYDDVLVDPLRYRMRRPLALARALLPWIPRPDLWLVLDAPSQLLSERGTELSAEETKRQRSEYRRLLRGYENVVVLDAREPLERVVAAAERAIVSYLADRTAERLRLPVPVPKNPFATEVLLFFCRRHIPVLSRLVRILYNSDIYCRLPAHIYMPHPYGIVMHAQAAIGERVTIMQQVTIGDKDQGENVAPVIGNDVFIGAGARVLGDVRIGDGVTIGANAVVTRDVPPGATVVGANRIIETPVSSDGSVMRFPVGLQRGG
jgi:thymidylate kinase